MNSSREIMSTYYVTHEKNRARNVAVKLKTMKLNVLIPRLPLSPDGRAPSRTGRNRTAMDGTRNRNRYVTESSTLVVNMLTDVESRHVVANRLKKTIPKLPCRHPAVIIRKVEFVIRLFVARSMCVTTMAYRPVVKKQPVMKLKTELMNSAMRLMAISPCREMKLFRELQTKYMTLSMTSGNVATRDVRPGVLMLVLIRRNIRPKFRRYRALSMKATSSGTRVWTVTPPSAIGLLNGLVDVALAMVAAPPDTTKTSDLSEPCDT